MNLLEKAKKGLGAASRVLRPRPEQPAEAVESEGAKQPAEKKYDVAVYGLWYGHNYGSIVTYYALSKILDSMKLSYAMIRNPLGTEVDIDTLPRSHPLRFAKEQYEITPRLGISELPKLNSMFDTFIIGSDQMWNYHLSRPYRQSYYFDFVNYRKNKIAYGTSFGRDPYNGPEEEKPLIASNLKRFNSISVRDDFSQRICSEEFDVEATLVCDPVFLCPVKKYHDLIHKVDIEEHKNPFIFAYILDPRPEIGQSLREISKKTGKRVLVIFDQHRYNSPHQIQDYLGLMGLSAQDNVTAIDDATANEWLYCFYHGEFVLTDSFHGACFSLIFNKNFIVLKNNGRGSSRFPFLLGELGLINRIIDDPAEFEKKHAALVSTNQFDIDYGKVNAILDKKKEASMDWLRNAINNPRELGPEEISPEQMKDLHPDIQRCQMVAGLMRDYGIRHVVVSSGARDVSLTRLFEANDCFTTYNVTDERSAAYYALGLALKLKEPVAITCTSGTAVSNYLPGITEAYYMQVPIAVISGDRYPCFLDQMEAQKTNHLGALASVVKASVELPVNWDGMGQWECRRKISEALLEMTHHGAGPVHINVPMSFLENKLPAPETLRLPVYRHIDRVEPLSPKAVWKNSLETLKKAKRIMVISGQAAPMDKEEKANFDNFCKKFNCVVITDHLSNLHNEYTVNPFNLLRKVGPKYFTENLMPDLVLYFGGKRVLNCPLQGIMRSIKRNFEFWRIDSDGKVADLYRTLTHVFEMPPDYFFEYFSDKAGETANNGEYCRLWKEKLSAYPQVDYTTVEEFNSTYTIGKTISVMPKNSMLHLGVGTSFNRAHYFDLDPSITVNCNMGTNGIDGSASTFMGQSCVSDELSFLFIGDLSFFYDMNSIWNKPMTGNIRILLNNDGGAGFLRHFGTPGITQAHNAIAKGWVESLGYTYLSASSKSEFDKNVKKFVSDSKGPIFMEAFIK